MKKYSIPPYYLFILLIYNLLMFMFLPQFNYLKFPYNFFGLLPVIAGFIFAGKTREALERNKTTHKFDIPAALVTDGVFAKSRNPMYCGMMLFLTGFSICFGNLFGFAAPVIFFCILNFHFIPFEEKMLGDKFSDHYFEYKSKVARWI